MVGTGVSRWRTGFAAALTVLLWAVILAPLPTLAHDDAPGDLVQPERARITLDSSGTLKRVALAPISLEGGSELTVITPERWTELAAQLSHSLTDAHNYFGSLFGEIPALKTSVRLMDEDSFYLTTGAPPWTNALYLRGQIIIPLPLHGSIDRENIARSLKHEYSHAVVHALSGGRAPGWLDEGLAQWVEGSENESLRPALFRYLRNNDPVPFALLQGGFTKLNTKMVAAAYAQSLYAAKSLITGVGFVRIGGFFSLLRKGTEQDIAFKRSFGISEQQFEERLSNALEQWSQHAAPPNL